MDQTMPSLSTHLTEARETAREQLLAAWQIHADRIREQLESGWQEELDHIFAERFAEMQNLVEQEFAASVEHRASEKIGEQVQLARTSAQREITEWLNQASRRLKQTESRDVWIRTFLEAVSQFCGRAALFAVAGNKLKFEGGLEIESESDIEIPLSDAPAFQNVIESKDTVVAAGTKGELSEQAAALLGDTSAKRIYLFPVLLRQKVEGILYAEAGADPVDVSALELVASLAANSITETEVVTVQAKRDDLVRIAGIDLSGAAPAATLPAVPRAEQEVHLKAQRFARTQVAHLLLYKVQQVKAGRATKDLYGTLKGEIDAGREAYREQFMATCPSMVDYYHQELVKTLANRDQSALGNTYPGPLG